MKKISETMEIIAIVVLSLVAFVPVACTTVASCSHHSEYIPTAEEVDSATYLTPSERAAEEAAGRLSDVIRNAMDNGDSTIYDLIDNYGVDSLLKKYSYCY